MVATGNTDSFGRNAMEGRKMARIGQIAYAALAMALVSTPAFAQEGGGLDLMEMFSQMGMVAMAMGDDRPVHRRHGIDVKIAGRAIQPGIGRPEKIGEFQWVRRDRGRNRGRDMDKSAWGGRFPVAMKLATSPDHFSGKNGPCFWNNEIF